MVCERCGHELVIGDYPFCKGDARNHVPSQAAIITDDIPGGQVIENLGHEELTFYSKKAIVAEADKRGLRLTDRYVPGDKHLTNWAAGIDAYTLAAAAVLVTRGQKAVEPDPAALRTLQTSISEVKHLG